MASSALHGNNIKYVVSGAALTEAAWRRARPLTEPVMSLQELVEWGSMTCRLPGRIRTRSRTTVYKNWSKKGGPKASSPRQGSGGSCGAGHQT